MVDLESAPTTQHCASYPRITPLARAGLPHRNIADWGPPLIKSKIILERLQLVGSRDGVFLLSCVLPTLSKHLSWLIAVQRSPLMR